MKDNKGYHPFLHWQDIMVFGPPNERLELEALNDLKIKRSYWWRKNVDLVH